MMTKEMGRRREPAGQSRRVGEQHPVPHPTAQVLVVHPVERTDPPYAHAGAHDQHFADGRRQQRVHADRLAVADQAELPGGQSAHDRRPHGRHLTQFHVDLPKRPVHAKSRP